MQSYIIFLLDIYARPPASIDYISPDEGIQYCNQSHSQVAPMMSSLRRV
jgi:hypothetical protein